jgi:predicted alpha/beta superfamily hydrolase
MKKISLWACLFLFTLQLTAQEEQFEYDYQIQSKAFGDERTITVYLPPSYYEYPDMKYTVTYVLDGHFDPFIDLGVKTIEYNTYMYKYTPTIVVGVHAKNRGWEFSAPLPGEEDDYAGGRAPELQQHFKNEIFPLIDSLYPHTLPFRNLIGHSSGGSFVLYTLFSDQKDLFDAYIAISPGMRPGEDNILEDASARLKAGEQFHKFLYCSSGTIGEREEIFGAVVARLDSILTAHPKHGLIWRKSTFDGMDHFTCVPPSFNTAMVELTRAFRVDEASFYAFAEHPTQSVTEQVEAFYQNRNTVYGFSEIPLPGYLYSIAFHLSTKEKNQEAMEIYNWGIKHHPDNYTLNKSKAKLLLKTGDKTAALEAFQHTQTVLEIVKEKMSANEYQKQQSYLEDKIAECMN